MRKKVSELSDLSDLVILGTPLSMLRTSDRVRETSKVFRTFCAWLFIFSALIFQNCTQPTEGCLDLRATNFDATASIDCNKTCQCTYPSLVVSTNYWGDTSSFSFNKTYKNNNKDSFKILSTQLYLSDFQLINDKNITFRTIDSVALTRAKDTIKVLNNYALLGKANGFDFTIGAFNGVGNFTKIKCRVGLDDVALKTIPSKMPSSHPLSIKADSMYISSANQYIAQKLVFVSGANYKDTFRINITTPTDLELTKPLVFTEGYNAKIPLKISYLEFFRDVDFKATENIVMLKIVSNTKNAFSIQ